MILAPTREICHQIRDTIIKLSPQRIKVGFVLVCKALFIIIIRYYYFCIIFQRLDYKIIPFKPFLEL